MKYLKIALIAIGIIVLILVAAYAYSGGFRKIHFRIEEQGGEVLVYEEVVGNYSQTATVQNKIYESLLNDEKIETTRGFGIYYDNPREVEANKLHSEVGCIVDGLDSTEIAKLAEKYQVKILPKENYVVTEFPFKGGMSVMVGIMRVYPALDKYCKENKIGDSPVMEIYDVANKKIIYRKTK